MDVTYTTTTVDGLATGYLEAGSGAPVVLLHGGEFGASAEIGWEKTIPVLAEHYRVIAPDMLGYGLTAKVLDFVDGRGMRIRHVAALCEQLGVDSAIDQEGDTEYDDDGGERNRGQCRKIHHRPPVGANAHW